MVIFAGRTFLRKQMLWLLKMIYCRVSACGKTALGLMVTLAHWTEVLDLISCWDSECTLCCLVFLQHKVSCSTCFLCCRCGSAVTRAGWPGCSTSARVPCASQQPSLRCSAQRPSSSTLSGASSSPAIWRKEHNLLLCRTVLVRACSKGLCFYHRSCMEKRFPRVFGSVDNGVAM